ncbi:MAG: DUF72 domain-containing protein [Thermodesulfobacteriota bacterium]
MTDSLFFVGTSGYSYTEWIDAGFYPPGTPSGRMLSLYSRKFSITELNYTWYQMPKPEAIERQRLLAPPSFLFTAKLTRTLTHEIEPGKWKEDAARYRDGITPLFQAGQLAAVLMQFPPSFTRTPEHRSHLAGLITEFEGLPLAVEFRHNSWVNPRVFKELMNRKVTLVSVDEPDIPGLFPSLDLVTNSELIYIRFHGRNIRGWRSGKMSIQFDYTYSDDELIEWIEQKLSPMSGKAKKGILFFNNHVRAQAPENAGRMIRLLKERGFAAA